MASKKKLSDWKERIAKGAKLPGGFTPTGWSLPGEGLPQIGGSIFGCPLVSEVGGEPVNVHCPKCGTAIVFDLQTLLTLGAAAVDPVRRDALEASLERGEMLCLMCQAYETAVKAAGERPVGVLDGDERRIEFEGLEIWVVDRWGKTLENWTYAGPPSELKATLEALRVEKGNEVSVYAMAAGSTSWKQRYAI